MRNKIMLTPQFLADLKEKAKQASPGPWFENGEVTICPPHGHRQEFDEVAHEGDGIYERSIAYCHLKADAAYIAAANPAVILALIEDYENKQQALYGMFLLVNQLKVCLNLDTDAGVEEAIQGAISRINALDSQLSEAMNALTDDGRKALEKENEAHESAD